jgi:hypothetical protein|tara:strand:+ start:253 stop:462 length:210 start_codon:yes stop_codon:yes gene_type:complete
METLKIKLSSRKFWAAFLGALLPPVLAFLSEDIALGEALKLTAGVCVSYILGQGYVDAAEKKAVATTGD